MRGISKLGMVLLAGAGLCAAQSGILFHLLSATDSGTTKNVREFNYDVSVDQYLEVSGIKNVVCQLIRSEKPGGYDVLSMGIYYRLEGYVAEAARDVAEGARHREQRIAQYHWFKDSPKDSRRLVVSKDGKGKSLPEWRYYDFDHAKSCR